MDRDPDNNECTRDPLFLLQTGHRKWMQMPSGFATDGESIWVEDDDEVEDWIRPFLDDFGCVECTAEFWEAAESQEGDNGGPLLFTEWNTECGFLTRKEATDWAEARKHRWEKWRVYCVPCECKLAEILNQYTPAEPVAMKLDQGFVDLVITTFSQRDSMTPEQYEEWLQEVAAKSYRILTTRLRDEIESIVERHYAKRILEGKEAVSGEKDSK